MIFQVNIAIHIVGVPIILWTTFLLVYLIICSPELLVLTFGQGYKHTSDSQPAVLNSNPVP